MKSLFNEPMLHFLFLGAVIFFAYELAISSEESDPQTIVVTQGRVESLVSGFARTWQRPPTQSELDGMIQDYIREEVCSREAVTIGLDRDDTIIRRRLRQKFEFLAEDLSATTEPTDDDLIAYLNAYPEDFLIDRRFTFQQVFLDEERRRATLADDIATLLTELNRLGPDADAGAHGDATMLDHAFFNITAADVAKQFGAAFAESLGGMAIGSWQGPIESGYGVHLVLVRSRSEPRTPALEEVRDVVRLQWSNEKRLETNERFFQSLLSRYTISIEPSALVAVTQASAGAP